MASATKIGDRGGWFSGITGVCNAGWLGTSTKILPKFPGRLEAGLRDGPV